MRILVGSKKTVISISLFLCFWVLLSFLKNDASVLPGPQEVWLTALQEFRSGELYAHTIATLFRVVIAFAIAMTLGFLFGLLLGRYSRLNDYLNPWVIILQNTPALVVIVLCYLWIGLNETAAIAAVCINKTAMVTVTIREGVQSMNLKYSEVAKIYRFSGLKHLRLVVFPQISPFIFAAARNGLAVIWKIVLVVEFLGRSDGIGFQIHLYFQLFETGYVMAYAFSFVAVIGCIEYLILRPLEQFSNRWRSIR